MWRWSQICARRGIVRRSSPVGERAVVPTKQRRPAARVYRSLLGDSLIEVDAQAKRIDFFTNHRKTIRYNGKDYATYISCPYTRVELGKR